MLNDHASVRNPETRQNSPDPGPRRSARVPANLAIAYHSLLRRSPRITCIGILTGSDGHVDAPLTRDMAAFGLAAEGISDGRVWLVKSDWPERRGAAEVRSPWSRVIGPRGRECD